MRLLKTDRIVYQDDDMALIHGDCRAMRELPDKSVDMIFTDPPFNLGKGRFDYGEETNESMTGPEYGCWTGEWMEEALRVLKRGGHFLSLMPEKWIKFWLPGAPEPFHFLPWCKTMSSYLGNEMTYNRASELIFWHWKGGKITTFNKAWTFHGDRDWFMGNVAVGEVQKQRTRKGHPAPRPIWLYERFVRKLTNPGDVVLDPFMGTGTGGIACKRLGRFFVGYEISEKYAASAAKHLSAMPKPMFEQAPLDIPAQGELSVH